VIKGLERQESQPSSEIFSTASLNKKFKKQKINKINKNKFNLKLKKSNFDTTSKFFQEDQHSNSFIISSGKDTSTHSNLSQEDLSQNSDAKSASYNLEKALKQPTLKSIHLSDQEQLDLQEQLIFEFSQKVENNENLVKIKSEGKDLLPNQEQKFSDLKKSIIHPKPRKNANMEWSNNTITPKKNYSVSTQITNPSNINSKKSIFIMRSKPQKTQRSLSAFVSRVSPSNNQVNKTLQNVSQKLKPSKLRTLTNLEIKDSLSLSKASKIGKQDLKFHYFGCCLEQYLEGWKPRRLLHKAKRKYTLKI
jgi:hypothetical protein